jgi:hypothetical protein
LGSPPPRCECGGTPKHLWAHSADGKQMVKTDGVKCMFFLVLFFFISYIFVLLQQEEDGTVSITLERHA